MQGEQNGHVIGNLSAEVGESDLSALFEQHGQVTAVNVMRDQVSGNMLGVAFVKMPDESAAHRAITGLNSMRIAGRVVMVCEAPQRIERRDFARMSSSPTDREYAEADSDSGAQAPLKPGARYVQSNRRSNKNGHHHQA